MDEYLGIVKLFAGTFVPKGWALCDGQLLNITQNTSFVLALGKPSSVETGETTFGHLIYAKQFQLQTYLHHLA